MSCHILKLMNVYSYQSERNIWTNDAPRKLNIVSYQLEGQYDHTFSFGVLKVKKDCVFTISPEDAYRAQKVEKGVSLCFTFTSETPIATELLDCSDDPRFSILFRKMLTYRNLNVETNDYHAMSIAYEILSLISEKKNRQYVPSAQKQNFVRARDEIFDHFCDSSLNLRDINAQYGISEKYFREQFRKLYGSTPTQYLIGLRLGEAAKLLTQGVLDVSEVAEAVGFSNVYYFSRLFKNKFMCPPSRFRDSEAAARFIEDQNRT